MFDPGIEVLHDVAEAHYGMEDDPYALERRETPPGTVNIATKELDLMLSVLYAVHNLLHKDGGIASIETAYENYSRYCESDREKPFKEKELPVEKLSYDAKKALNAVFRSVSRLQDLVDQKSTIDVRVNRRIKGTVTLPEKERNDTALYRAVNRLGEQTFRAMKVLPLGDG